MSDTTTVEQPTIEGTDTMADGEAEKVTYEKGTWQATLHRASTLFDKSANEKKRATVLLWSGAQAAIEEWLPNSDTDVSAEGLYTEIKGALGEHRKGDASKIKTVAVAVKKHGLLLSLYPSMTKAYAEARRLTQTVQQEAAEDEAAEKAISSIEAPKTASTPESAAMIVLSKGLDEAARLLLDALGAENEQAHRSLMRAISQEIAGRVKPKVSVVKAGPKEGATQATPGKRTKPAAVKTAGTKAKPSKAKPEQSKAQPVSASKGDPNRKPLPRKKAQPVVKAKPNGEVTEPVHAGDDMPDHTEAAPAPVKKARPVVKRSA